MNELKLALRVDDLDNVATIFADDVDLVLVAFFIMDNDLGAVGHKIAVRDIKAGEHIMKYGQSIGVADVDIKKGEYVHIHNMKALRGRGDL